MLQCCRRSMIESALSRTKGKSKGRTRKHICVASMLSGTFCVGRHIRLKSPECPASTHFREGHRLPSCAEPNASVSSPRCRSAVRLRYNRLELFIYSTVVILYDRNRTRNIQPFSDSAPLCTDLGMCSTRVERRVVINSLLQHFENY